MTHRYLDSMNWRLLLDCKPPTIEERIAAFGERQEARFQEDWAMAIGINALRDLGLEVPDGRG